MTVAKYWHIQDARSATIAGMAADIGGRRPTRRNKGWEKEKATFLRKKAKHFILYSDGSF